jgi:transcription elongation factor Elf1
MVKFHVFTPVVDEFISLFEQHDNIRWKKIWKVNGKTIGVYFIEEFPSIFSAESVLLNIIFDHDKDEEYCQIWLEPFGTGVVLSDKTMKEIIRSIGNIAMSNKWKFERVVARFGGDTCPYCKATYRYNQDPNSRTTLRTCQNCGKEYDTDVPREVEKEWGDIRIKPTTCPYCKAEYFYKRKHIQDDNTVACQNCGESFVLDIDDWTKYSYEWYQEDDDIQ